MMKRSLSFLLLLALMITLLVPAQAEGPTLSSGGLTLGNNAVSYPQLTGMADEALQQQVNDTLLAAGHIQDRLTRLALVMSNPAGLQVTWDAVLEGDILSCVYSAMGAVENDRSTHVYSAVTVDLRDGRTIAFEDLFTDMEGLMVTLEEYLDYGVGPDLSAHLFNSQMLPVPDDFTISPTGLTLYYPIDQLSTLSDRAGAVTVHWWELREYLNLAEDSVLARMGVPAMLEGDAQSAGRIRAAVEAGVLPGIPVQLGGSVQEATDVYRMLTDPDLYQDGRMFALEDAAFRKVYILTDALTDKTWDRSVIHGIRADRINLYGLYTGMAREDALALMGEADASVTLTVEAAEAWRLDAGTSDYYQFTGMQLRLHYDEEGRLCSLIITQTD